LAEHVGGSVERFVAMMNAKAKRLGMRDTRFASASGLEDAGYSTARDLLILSQEVMQIGAVARIVATKFAEIPDPDGKPREIQNRNVLLWLYPGAIGLKTGYTTGARFCLVAVAERENLRLATVVLGAPTPEGQFGDSAALLNYGFAAFERHTFVHDGQPLGSLQIPGGAVSGSAAGTLEALVPTSQADAATQRFVPAPDAAFPPAPGDEIGSLLIEAGPLDLGDVPVIAASVPPPPPAEEGPWWRRTLTSLTQATGELTRSLLT